MSKTQAASTVVYHAGGNGLFQAFFLGRLLDELAAWFVQQRHGKQGLATGPAQPLDPLLDQALDAVGHGQRLAGRREARPGLEDSSDLEGEERIAPAGEMHATQNGPRERQVETRPEQAVGGAEAERAQPDTPQPIAEGAIQPKRSVAVFRYSSGQQESDGILA